jgi:hypothetical protein
MRVAGGGGCWPLLLFSDPGMAAGVWMRGALHDLLGFLRARFPSAVFKLSPSSHFCCGGMGNPEELLKTAWFDRIQPVFSRLPIDLT